MKLFKKIVGAIFNPLKVIGAPKFYQKIIDFFEKYPFLYYLVSFIILVGVVALFLVLGIKD